MRQAYIGVDVGSTSARAGVFDEAGKLLGSARHPIRVWHEPGDIVEQSSDDIWAACVASVRHAMREAAVAAEQVKGAAPDGNTLLFTHPGQLIVNEVAGLTEDSFETFDVACIAGVDKSTVFVASKQSGVTSMQDLIDKSKAKPGSITYGTEMGSFSHVQGLMLEKLTDIKLKMVDGGTVSDRVVGMLGGRLDLGAITYGSVQDYVSGGQMVALGQPNDERNPLLGDVPTLKEQGLDITMDKPYVVAFPKGTDPAIVKKMADVMKQITEIPEYAEDLKKFKQPVAYYGTDEAKQILAKTREDVMQFKDELRQAKK